MSIEPTMSGQSQAPQHAAQPHVLVVDDAPAIRELVTDYLSGNELRVSAVADGKAMQEILADQVVDLVVLDLKLRGEDGMALARRLRDESQIPIVMLTGRSEEADRVMGLELGADDYLTKPFSPRELLARIRSILRRRRAEPHPLARPAAGSFPAAQRRGLQPVHRRSDHAAAPQDRARCGEAALHPDRARRGISVRRAGGDRLLEPENPVCVAASDLVFRLSEIIYPGKATCHVPDRVRIVRAVKHVVLAAD